MLVVPVTVALRDENLDFLSYQLAPLIAEHRFGLGVDLDDGSVFLNGNDGVGNGFQKWSTEKNFANRLRGKR